MRKSEGQIIKKKKIAGKIWTKKRFFKKRKDSCTKERFWRRKKAIQMHWRCNTVFSLRKAGIFDLDLFFLEEGIEGLEERKKKNRGN